MCVRALKLHLIPLLKEEIKFQLKKTKKSEWKTFFFTIECVAFEMHHICHWIRSRWWWDVRHESDFIWFHPKMRLCFNLSMISSAPRESSESCDANDSVFDSHFHIFLFDEFRIVCLFNWGKFWYFTPRSRLTLKIPTRKEFLDNFNVIARKYYF